MDTTKGSHLVKSFIQALNASKGISIIHASISRNVFEFKGRGNYLLYVKGRAEHPHRWGVTANVTERLKAQMKPWALILLFESYHKGYFLDANDVEDYIDNVWPLARDGDYKPSPGSYLAANSPIYSIRDFIDKIEGISPV